MNIIRPMLLSYVPRFLYKYTSVDSALEVLQTEEVYFSHRQELNDPFDGKQTIDLFTCEKRKEAMKNANQKIKKYEEKGHDLSGMLSGMNREEYHKRFIKDEEFANSQMQKFAKSMDIFNIGVYCFAEQNDSIVMWAHYANNHKGCCLEFNLQEHVSRYVEKGKPCFPFSFLRSVKYSDKHPVHVIGEEDAYPKENSAYISKSEDWRYEKEWRAIMYDASVISPISGKSIGDEIPDESIKRMKGSGHYPLDKNLLHGIILGYKMKKCEKKSIIDAALSRRIKIYQAQPKLYEYGMEIKPLHLAVVPKKMLL